MAILCCISHTVSTKRIYRKKYSLLLPKTAAICAIRGGRGAANVTAGEALWDSGFQPPSAAFAEAHGDAARQYGGIAAGAFHRDLLSSEKSGQKRILPREIHTAETLPRLGGQEQPVSGLQPVPPDPPPLSPRRRSRHGLLKRRGISFPAAGGSRFPPPRAPHRGSRKSTESINR